LIGRSAQGSVMLYDTKDIEEKANTITWTSSDPIHWGSGQSNFQINNTILGEAGSQLIITPDIDIDTYQQMIGADGSRLNICPI
jgi:hypothetical protein